MPTPAATPAPASAEGLPPSPAPGAPPAGPSATAPGGIAARVEAAPQSGCLVCGAELVYRIGAAPVTCALCGAAGASSATCAAGHFVCDACHSGSAKDVIERTCAATELRDPIAIVQGLMRHPSVKLHGPEHHFLVPAALLAAWSNVRGEPERRAERVAEARRRSDPIVGGMCGYQGACGAAIGTGIFASVATGATPLSTGPWRQANAMTARALDLVARSGGPRCCKRDTFLSVLAAARFARSNLGVALPARGVACEWSDRNAQCLGEGCAFHRDAAGARAGSSPRT